ncbi:MAG: 50S ribosomal protein L37e [Candidatus Methanoperedens sp.]|nr:50S ribosomal protein L37e [Candidatus Methanoperedens sp.]
MSKGTPSFGKNQKKTHVVCRRCGKASMNTHTKMCSACGFGRTAHMRSYKWQEKCGY